MGPYVVSNVLGPHGFEDIRGLPRRHHLEQQLIVLALVLTQDQGTLGEETSEIYGVNLQVVFPRAALFRCQAAGCIDEISVLVDTGIATSLAKMVSDPVRIVQAFHRVIKKINRR
ncbi:hypothetical protein ACFQY9_09070 [Microvirga aerilata]|uniref:hypothetical protein n=1 Tax=Microvirga aerilata TaxID=670292 RepID=UPI00363231EA